MDEETQELRRINWREALGFTHIFGSFRLSRQKTKLVLALAAVLLSWGAGKVLDLVFTPFSKVHVSQQSPRVEPQAFWQRAGRGDFAEWKKQTRDAVRVRVEKLAVELFEKKQGYDSIEKAKEAAKDDPNEVLDKALASLKKAHENQVGQARKLDDRKAREAAVREANGACLDGCRELDQLRPQGPFATFIRYEEHYFRQAVEAVLHGDIFSGFNNLSNMRRRAAGPTGPGVQLLSFEPAGEQLGLLTAGSGDDPLGLLAFLALMGAGVAWLAWEHWLFAAILFVALLVIWSLVGGAIARAAALQATRDEKAGELECLKFAAKRWLSFLSSPLVPLAILLVGGLLTTVVVSALGGIPGFGGLWIGLTFWVALIAAVVMSFLLIGLVGGGLLMFPTIAVEGSDTFDACTRSYQFVLTRPWRAGLYGLVAAGYGTICYLFVRFFLFLVLKLAHGMTGLLVWYTGRAEVREGATKWDLMWSGPTFENLQGGGVAPLGLAGGLNPVDWFGGWMVWCWVALVGAVLVAWVISYVISASTYIYLLLRRVEDATDMDEVFVEEPPEEPEAAGEPAQPAQPAPAEAPPAPSEPPPPAAPPQPGTPPPTA